MLFPRLPISTSEISPHNKKPGNMKGPECGEGQKRKRKRDVISTQWEHKYDFHLVLSTEEWRGTITDACHASSGTLDSESQGPERWDLRGYSNDLLILWSHLKCLDKELRREYSVDQMHDLFFM